MLMPQSDRALLCQSGRDVDDKTLHILFAANRWQAAAGIRQALDKGTIVSPIPNPHDPTV